MKRAAVAGLALLGIAGALLLWARFFADPPIGPIPGGALAGTPTPPPEDWRIAEGIQHLPVQHLGSTLPYSGRYWFMLAEGRVHLILPSLFGRGMHERLQDDPRVQVRIGESLYEQVATPVDSADVFSAGVPALVYRQFAIEVQGTVRPLSGTPPVETWIWRLDDPIDQNGAP